MCRYRPGGRRYRRTAPRSASSRFPAIRDRVVQGALKLILEPIFEADFQPGSFGYRPRRTAHEAVDRVAKAIVQHKTRVIDIDLRSYFDNVRHDRLFAKVAQRVDDAHAMRLLKIMLKANGRCGVPQGGVSPQLLSNLYLTEVDRMLERAKERQRAAGRFTYIEYARFADDLVILIDAYPRHAWLLAAVEKRLREERADLQVEINEEKSRIVDLGRGESFGFLGFDFRRIRSRRASGVPPTRRSSRTERHCCETQGRVPTLPVSTGGSGDRSDQPCAARLGQLLRGRAFQRMLQLRSKTGWKRRSGATCCGLGNARVFRLDAVE